MYIPSAFRVDDLSELREFMERHSFEHLFSQHAGSPIASHLPLLYESDGSPHGCVVGHMARANPQWQSLTGQKALAVFSGPHVYVSPRWYAEPNVVPTWNYTAVHASGPCQIVEERTELARILTKTVAYYEEDAWSIDPDSEFFQKLAAAVVGFRIEIEELEGKWKLSQNHSTVRRERVIEQLSSRSDENSREIAELMQAALDSGK